MIQLGACQVYGGYVYPRHLGQVAAPGAMAADNKQMTQQEIAGAELQQHSMSEAVAWRLAERALHAEELATAPERLQASHVAGATARNVRVHLEINQRTCTTTHAPAFVLTYGFGVKLVEYAASRIPASLRPCCNFVAPRAHAQLLPTTCKVGPCGCIAGKAITRERG
jgi:hypothetical protein